MRSASQSVTESINSSSMMSLSSITSTSQSLNQSSISIASSMKSMFDSNAQ